MRLQDEVALVTSADSGIDRATAIALAQAAMRAYAAVVPMGRFGQPDQVARAVLWLLSNEASFLTGETLLMDGGYRAR